MEAEGRCVRRDVSFLFLYGHKFFYFLGGAGPGECGVVGALRGENNDKIMGFFFLIFFSISNFVFREKKKDRGQYLTSLRL